MEEFIISRKESSDFQEKGQQETEKTPESQNSVSEKNSVSNGSTKNVEPLSKTEAAVVVVVVGATTATTTAPVVKVKEESLNKTKETNASVSTTTSSTTTTDSAAAATTTRVNGLTSALELRETEKVGCGVCQKGKYNNF